VGPFDGNLLRVHCDIDENPIDALVDSHPLGETPGVDLDPVRGQR
jgi:hypothetical protein